MSDVVEMIRASVSREESTRDRIRSDFPGCAAIIDQFRAVFGEQVKPTYFKEGDKEMGKKAPDFDDDSAKWIWLGMTDKERSKSLRGGK